MNNIYEYYIMFYNNIWVIVTVIQTKCQLADLPDV